MHDSSTIFAKFPDICKQIRTIPQETAQKIRVVSVEAQRSASERMRTMPRRENGKDPCKGALPHSEQHSFSQYPG